MFVDDGCVIYSASDLAAATRCEYALLRVFDHRLGRGPLPADDDDAMLARTAALGDAHERRLLDELVERHGGGVVTIGRPAYTVAAMTAAAAQTANAFAAGAAVVYQPALFDGRFAGFADFAVRDEQTGAYRVLDTKLARHAKVTALLQIAAYADVLRRAGVEVAPTACLVLGDQSVVEYPVDDIVAVYRRQRVALQELLDRHYAAGVAVRWEDHTVAACMRCAVCEPHVRHADDLLLVAGMRVSQRAALLEAGIATVAELAANDAVVAGMAARTLNGLTAQARIQLRQRHTGAAEFEVIDADPLGALPAPDAGDVFFDFEGDPLWTADGVEWGLEYLFGVLERNGAFRPLWAHDMAGERSALVTFLARMRKRRQRHPNMHIYHYSGYEKSALLRLAGRYGVGEDDVDDLLRSEVLVDLYPIVRNAIRVGAESYGLKALEPLYMGEVLRHGEVTNATDSITEYARYCVLGDAGRHDEAAVVLKQIEDYNHYDCTSTRHLRDWLLLRAFEHGVTHLTRPAPPGEPVPPDDQTARTLAGYAGDPAAGDLRTADQTAAALLGSARGYFARERKPFWWSHFDRLTGPLDEWADTSGVFVVDHAHVQTDWHLPPGKRKARRHVRLAGTLCGGALDTDVSVLYDRPAPPGLDDDHPDRRAVSTATVIDTVDTAAGVPLEVVIQELAPAAGPFAHLPVAIAPGFPFRTDSLEAAIEAVAADAADAVRESSSLPPGAVMDILRRRPPTTVDGAGLPRLGDDVGSITAAMLRLSDSYVAVHGPPGTGKTHTGAQVMTSLVAEHGWRIGVVAQSHAVVEHVLDQVVAAGSDPDVVAKHVSGERATSPAWQIISKTKYADFIVGNPGCVIGGTAWDFSHNGRVPPGSLDLLVIDEAGQFSLANTIAVSAAARNLLLLGDPQQLPQVSTGVHPEPVDCSALGWLVDDRDVLPDEFGYFLEHTYRMHPAVCQAVSALSYQNRLRSHPVAAARSLAGLSPGVRTICVDHQDNDTASAQEAAAIAGEIARLLGSTWTDEHGSRPLAAADILVVAPYNAQVLCLRSHLVDAGLAGVRVGTVDKLQGQQAAVVFVSMTASAIDDIPRGISFLLNRNRLNVAISRAKYAAMIVRSPRLTDHLPASPADLIGLGAFLSLSPGAGPQT